MENMSETIERLEALRLAAAANTQDKVKHLENLGIAFAERQNATGPPQDLDKALEHLREAVRLTEDDDPERGHRVTVLGVLYFARFDYERSIDAISYLDAAIRTLQEGLDLTPVHHPDHTDIIGRLSEALNDRYLMTKSSTDLDTAIGQVEQLLLELPVDGAPTTKIKLLADLADYYGDRYEKTKLLVDLDAAISSNQAAVDLTGPIDMDGLAEVRLEKLAKRYQERYLRTGALDDLTNVVVAVQQRLDMAAHEFPKQRIPWLKAAAAKYCERYLNLGTVDDYEIGLMLFREAMELIALTDPVMEGTWIRDATAFSSKYLCARAILDIDSLIRRLDLTLEITSRVSPDQRVVRLQDLATAYSCRYMRRGSISDLRSAIERFGQIIDLSPPETSLSLQAAWRQQAAVGHYEEFRRTRALDSLSKCIRSYQEALNLVPEACPQKQGIVAGLTKAFQARYRISGEASDFDQVTQLSQQGHELTPKSYIRELEHMTETCRRAYEISGEMSDLDALIGTMEQALVPTPLDDPKRTDKLEALGAEYIVKYLRTREVDDVSRAIQCIQESYSLTPTHHTLARTSRLHRLSMAHIDRHERTGSIVDLDAAIQNLRIVIRDTENHHPDRPRRLQSLGVGYGERYQSSGGLADIDNAIKQFEDALALTVDDDSLKASLSSALGTAYLGRYKRTQVPWDLDAGIKMCQEAVKFPLKATDRADCLHLLAMGYSTRARSVGAESDLDEVIRLVQETLELTADSDPRRSRQFHTLSVYYQNKFSKTKDQRDLEMAIQQVQQALARALDDVPEKPSYLRDLGSMFRDKFIHTGDKSYIVLASQNFLAAANHPASTPLGRFSAGKDLFYVFCKAKLWPMAHQIGSGTVGEISHLAPRSISNADKQHFMTQVAGLTSDATAATLLAGEGANKAIELLELGRGIILGSLMETRTDLTELRKQHPEIAKRLVTLQTDLTVPDRLRPSQFIHRHNAAQQIEQTVHEIRALPGFDRFLQLPLEEEMKAAAAFGPVVMINTSEYGCDALIIEGTGMRSLSLPRLQIEDVRYFSAGKLRNNRDVLEWLWDTIAQPVLDSLGFTTRVPEDGTWPRLWWIPTGLVGMFPIHAAGYHHDGSRDRTVMDRVISSYSPSIRALIHSRQSSNSRSTPPRHPSKVVLVGMPELPYAPREVKRISQVYDSAPDMIATSPGTTREAVRTALKDCKIFHFAGHGRTDPLNPSNSGLVLSDGYLNVSDLFESSLQDGAPYLAYLSACGTGRIRNSQLADESLHLIGACQMAGFQNVVGTLWEVEDRSCVDVAVRTYEWIKSCDMGDRSVSGRDCIER